jgi:hypothetical protein
MAVRAWLNTNYYDYVKNSKGLREKPLFSGFVLLSPRQKRFLAHLASNPKGHLGSSPPLPKFLESAIQNGQFSATLLVEPGLVHYELGWPNMLRWSEKYDALEVELRGGFILRIAKGELVVGSSFLARAKLRLAAEFDLELLEVVLALRLVLPMVLVISVSWMLKMSETRHLWCDRLRSTDSIFH